MMKKQQIKQEVIDQLKEMNLVTEEYLENDNDVDSYYHNLRKEWANDAENVYVTNYEINEKEGEHVIDSHELYDIENIWITLTSDR